MKPLAPHAAVLSTPRCLSRPSQRAALRPSPQSLTGHSTGEKQPPSTWKRWRFSGSLSTYAILDGLLAIGARPLVPDEKHIEALIAPLV